MSRRYAEGTTTPAESSQAEIRGLLVRYGCDGFALGENRQGTHIQFELGRRQYRFGVESPTEDDVVVRIPTHHKLYAGTMANAIDAEWRRRWRARVLWLKATLEFAVDEGEVPTALAGFLVLQGGATVGQAITEGTLPMLGPGR